MHAEPSDRQPDTRQRSVALSVTTRIVVTLVIVLLSHGIATVGAQYLWFRTSDIYGEAMYIIRNSSELEKKIGGSIVAGWPLIYRNVWRGVGQVSARLPVHGASGAATVLLRAKNRGGSWEYQQLEARVDVDSSSIDLMPHAWRPQKLVLRGYGRLYFVGIGNSLRVDVNALARHYDELYDLDITVLPTLPYGARWQYATELIDVLKSGLPDLVASPQAVIIAVTDIDMDWYSWREDDRFAVVSTAGLTTDQFGKQVSKCLGLLWFELPHSADSRSLLYDDVSGARDLDLMSDQF